MLFQLGSGIERGIAVCGSDLHAYLAEVPKFPTANTPDPLSGQTLPITLGHEISGTVVELGAGVAKGRLSVGTNVVVDPLVSCMRTETCQPCRDGNRNICPLVNCIGIGGWGGGLAEYITVNAKYVYALPAHLSLEVGACLEPLAVAWHAVKRAKFQEGQSALVIGAGPIGLSLLMVLRSFSPSTPILVSEPAKTRRAFALDHGATQALDPTTADVVAAALAATNGNGVDMVFDAAGVQASLNTAIAAVRPRGVICNVAMWERDASLNVNQLLLKEIWITGTAAYDGIHEELIQAVAEGKITGIEKLITNRIPIEDVVEKGIMSLLEEKDTQVKILVHP
ncbi:alcohol dehydrogenase GroES domain protein [Infundibulicybe gibba]|nr:alcohol dehydrogenase GroES domain protein [Infundibulicybe gibba]